MVSRARFVYVGPQEMVTRHVSFLYVDGDSMRFIDHYELANLMAILQHLKNVEFERSLGQLCRPLWALRNPEAAGKYDSAPPSALKKRWRWQMIAYQQKVTLYMVMMAAAGLVQYKEMKTNRFGSGSQVFAQIKPEGRVFYSKFWQHANWMIERFPFPAHAEIKGGKFMSEF